SLILGQDRTKLSKRHGATSVSAYAEAGFLAEAMVNYLTMLGWSAPDGRDVFDRDYAIANFALDRVNSAPAVFDPQKFEWLNGQYIHSMSAAELRPLVVNAIGFDAPWLEEAIEVVKTSVHLLPQFKETIRFVTDYMAPEIEREFAVAVAADLRENGAPLDTDAVKAMNERLKKTTGRKGKDLFMPLRLMLTGMDHGPELVRAIPLLERASESDPRVLSPLARIDQVIAQCIR
ncbi:MAG TPA: glutamate--tRNA ligase family protein, partial [Thermoanaerobaculia bacterium]|nr:glutamate--tRNA ligase family protein [Thermoanaerobaculia bacterium]